VNLNNLGQDMDNLWARLKMAMKIRISYNAKKFLYCLSRNRLFKKKKRLPPVVNRLFG
jgi:hypothetical protein